LRTKETERNERKKKKKSDQQRGGREGTSEIFVNGEQDGGGKEPIAYKE